MLRKTLSLVTFTLVLILTAACNSSKQVSLTTAEKGSQVDVKVGDQIVITLDGNPSTGYTWESLDLDTTIFEQVGEPAFSQQQPRPGRGGWVPYLDIQSCEGGDGYLTLVYHRPWETGVDPSGHVRCNGDSEVSQTIQ